MGISKEVLEKIDKIQLLRGENKNIIKDDSMILDGILSFLDIEHSILINNQIGLIGDGIDNPKEPSKLREEYKNTELAKLCPFKDIPVRGKSFKVLDNNGVLLIPYDVSHTFIIQEHCTNIADGYIFIISDKEVTDIFNNRKSCIISYIHGSFETNSKEIADESKDISYNMLLDCEYYNGVYKFNNGKTWYISSIANKNNKIYWLKQVKLRL